MNILISFLLTALFYVPPIAAAAPASQTPPSSPSAPSPSGTQPAASSPSPRSNGKNRPIPSFLITGTIFNEQARSFAGVQVRIRRTGEKKFRWETYTDSRGEFAVRVPPGQDYEVVTHVKNYQDIAESVDSKVDVQQRLSIKLAPREQGKAGGKS